MVLVEYSTVVVWHAAGRAYQRLSQARNAMRYWEGERRLSLWCVMGPMRRARRVLHAPHAA